jgi:hypothetical protein
MTDLHLYLFLCVHVLLIDLAYFDECGQNWNFSVGVLAGGELFFCIYYDVKLACASTKEKTGLTRYRRPVSKGRDSEICIRCFYFCQTNFFAPQSVYISCVAFVSMCVSGKSKRRIVIHKITEVAGGF